ncbi:MAG: TetR/AcrR family transcriptional regulator [Erysipelotrichaceae bacterium]|nr:TetR/AcrR family transcriptional regulator [Erysipelotrichaceae bacterium]
MRKEAKQSKEKIIQSFISLLKNKPYDQITITEICQKAHVSRQTFYSHYQNKDVIFSDLYLNMLNELCIPKMTNINYFYSDEFFKTMIDSFDKWSDLYLTLKQWDVLNYLTKNNIDLIAQIIVDKTNDPYIRSYPNYFINYIYEPLTSICLNWVLNGKQESKEELFKIIKHFQMVHK